MATFDKSASFVSPLPKVFNKIYFHEFLFIKVANKICKSALLRDKDYSINERKFKHTIVFSNISGYKRVYLNKINIFKKLGYFTRNEKKSIPKYTRGILCHNNNFESNRFKQTFKILTPFSEVPP